jgi:hypothetical protein
MRGIGHVAQNVLTPLIARPALPFRIEHLPKLSGKRVMNHEIQSAFYPLYQWLDIGRNIEHPVIDEGWVVGVSALEPYVSFRLWMKRSHKHHDPSIFVWFDTLQAVDRGGLTHQGEVRERDLQVGHVQGRM